jgi:UDP-N-acetylglucosamine 2-epimerase
VAGITGCHHFAPTPDTADNLMAEGVSTAKIDIVGNTIVDQLYKATVFKKEV